MPEKQKIKAKGKKLGRNKKWCEVYRKLNHRLKKKIRRIKRHLKHHENDKVAKAALQRLS